MRAVTTLLTLLALVQANSFVHDMDDQQHLAMITESGLNLSKQNNEAYLKIGSNNGSTGYTWIIDQQSCKRYLDISSGYVFYEPETDDGWDVGYGEEIFTLTAKRYGNCIFRIAYARSWEFVDFEDHINQNGYVIEIPIRVKNVVPQGNDNTDTSSGGAAYSLDEKAREMD